METKIDCTGDVVTGDVIRWTEGVFAGSFRSPMHIGDRTITGKVVNESYGAGRQQHTFTIEVIEADGTDPPAIGKRIKRKGRNIYRNGTTRAMWDDETARLDVLNEKHDRGDVARAERQQRETGGRYAGL